MSRDSEKKPLKYSQRLWRVTVIYLLIWLPQGGFSERNKTLKSDTNADLYLGTVNKSDLDSRIRFGERSEKDAYPWLGYILRKTANETASCGGSLISYWHVLTAKHCFRDSNAMYIFAWGEVDFTWEPKTKIRGFTKIKRYPEKGHDIAVGELTSSIHVETVCLPPPGINVTGKKATIAGWGKDESNVRPKALMETTTTILSDSECEGPYVNTTIHTCAFSTINPSNHGDSGGPLFIKQDDLVMIVGIIHGGRGTGFPGVFSRVSYYLEWIKHVTKNHYSSCFVD